MDLTEFLTARWDAEEHLAAVAHPSPWEASDGVLKGAARDHATTGHMDDIAEGWDPNDGYAPDAATFEHAAYWDPARVLADLTAKRSILELHGGARIPATCCPRETEGYTVVDWYGTVDPCPTLRLLAAPYSDHPDFDDAWRLP